jgi:hypothetical protein
VPSSRSGGGHGCTLNGRAINSLPSSTASRHRPG